VRTKWVWSAGRLANSSDEFVAGDLVQLQSSYLNGTKAVPCPKFVSGNGLTLYGAQIQAEGKLSPTTLSLTIVFLLAIAYVGLNGVEAYPLRFDQVSVTSEELEFVLGFPPGSIPPVNWCVETTNPLCPSVNDLREI